MSRTTRTGDKSVPLQHGDIRIESLDVERSASVSGSPQNLRTIYFVLSETPSDEWIAAFGNAWLEVKSQMAVRRIARIEGNRLTCLCTPEDLTSAGQERSVLDALKEAVALANASYLQSTQPRDAAAAVEARTANNRAFFEDLSKKIEL